MNSTLDVFEIKNKYLREDTRFKQIFLEEFVRFIFERNNELPFQNKGNYEPLKYNAIFLEVDEEKSKGYILTKELEELKEVRGKDFVIMSPITYVGRNRTAKNSRYCYGLTFDIDGVKEPQIRDILHQMNRGHIPEANIIVNSGNGVHLYYLFDKPIALFDNVKLILKDFKYHLTERLWNAYTSSIKLPQFQGIYQGFRLPESKTKFKTEVTAFKNINRKELYTISELNKYVFPEYELKQTEIELIENAIYKSNRFSLNKAKELYPDWYEKRIIKGENRGKWYIKKDLYNWWLKKLTTSEVREGHRYFCIMALAMYAIKCNVAYEELEKDAYNLLEPMDYITNDEDNHFTEDDVKDALRAYKENYATFPRKDIETVTGIRIDKNKRNGRKQSLHLKMARASLEILNEENGKFLQGRKSKKDIVKEWRKNNPDGRKIDCERETELSRHTVLKWWDS